MRKNLSFVLLVILLSAFFCGCAPKRQTKFYADLLSDGYSMPNHLTVDELIEKVDSSNTQIQRFKANLKLLFKDYIRQQGASSFQCRGKIAISKPYRLRLSGYSFIAGTLFDIGSDGDKFFIYLPKDTKALIGSSEFPQSSMYPAIRIRPNDIMESFMLQNLSQYYKDNICFYEYFPQHYIIYVVNKTDNDFFLKKKIWVSAKNYEIFRHKSFNKDGTVKLEVIISKFFDFDEKGYFPKKMEVLRPNSHLDLVMEFSSVELDPQLDDNIFLFKKPDNVELINLD